jgi:CHAD domain-containing protein
MALDQREVEKPIRKLRKLLKKLPKQPTPEQVHDLRTNTRRLEATLEAFGLARQAKGEQLLKDISRVRKGCGKVRDMDVLTSDASGLETQRDKDCKVQLIEYLGAERRRHAKKLNTVVNKHGSKIRKELKQIAGDVDDLIGAEGDKKNNSTEAASKAAASALKLEMEISSPARLGRKNLHPYRLKVKELRNVLRLAADKDDEFIKTMGEVKDVIGDWHDWEELLAIANDLLDHGPNCGVLQELKRVCGEKYTHALAVTQNMRRKYLRVSPGKRKQQGRKPAESVWMATRAIAA